MNPALSEASKASRTYIADGIHCQSSGYALILWHESCYVRQSIEAMKCKENKTLYIYPNIADAVCYIVRNVWHMFLFDKELNVLNLFSECLLSFSFSYFVSVVSRET